MSLEELVDNLHDQNSDNAVNRFLDDEYYVKERFAGENHVHFDAAPENYVVFPLVLTVEWLGLGSRAVNSAISQLTWVSPSHLPILS